MLALAGVSMGVLCCRSSDTADFVSFARIDSAAQQLQDKYTDAKGLLLAGFTPDTTRDIPDMVSATYEGLVTGDVAGKTLTGQLTMEVELHIETAGSTATGYFSETAGRYTGTLTGPFPKVALALEGDIWRKEQIPLVQLEASPMALLALISSMSCG